MNHTAFDEGYNDTTEIGSSLTYSVPAKHFVPGTMFVYAAGVRAKMVALAVGVSLDPAVHEECPGYRSPNAVPGALDWYLK